MKRFGPISGLIAIAAAGVVVASGCAAPFACRPVDDAFFATAPRTFESESELPVPAAVAFRAMEDADAWPHWYGAIRHVQWTSAKPFGVGTTRDVTLASATLEERFYRWDTDHRISFYVSSHVSKVPLFRALAEDYTLVDLPGGRSRFIYRVALEPTWFLRLTWPIFGGNLETMFHAAPAGLAKYLSTP